MCDWEMVVDLYGTLLEATKQALDFLRYRQIDTVN